MTVHFVYRCHYNNPSEKHIRHFEADTVLDWFRSIWRPIPSGEESWAFVEGRIGCWVHSFGRLFVDVAEQHWPPPATMRQLVGYLESSLHVDEIKAGKNHVQIYTDDDDLEMVIHIFDDHYVAAHPERAAFLLHEDWQLPDGAGDGSFRSSAPTRLIARDRGGRGRTWLAILAYYASDNIDGLSGAERIDGVRLPDLARFLLSSEPDEDRWPRELIELRDRLGQLLSQGTGEEAAFLARIADDLADRLTWDVYSDWLQEHGQPRAGSHLLSQALRAAEPGFRRDTRDSRLDLQHVGEHLAQVCKHTHTSMHAFRGRLYHQWIFFDDLWASAHPHLAASLLRFAARWDVL
jgi:uncharacterized protein (TIGR02996 family)